MSKEAAEKARGIAVAAANAAWAAGASSVIVMVGVPDGDAHSAYGVRSYGRCLELRGLLETGAEELRRVTLAYPDKPA